MCFFITLVYLGWYSKVNITSFIQVCQILSIWKLQAMHRFSSGPLHRDRFFSFGQQILSRRYI